ncbi:MAG TPA: hypothetical protein VLB84_12130, partial [Bacteroidia bacterium]|nr:hypothetical protein [Bacteroidia bacterium]
MKLEEKIKHITDLKNLLEEHQNRLQKLNMAGFKRSTSWIEVLQELERINTIIKNELDSIKQGRL